MLDITFTKIAANSRVTDEISFSKMTVTGREKLAHEVVRALLTGPGTSVFNTEYGGGFNDLAGYAFEDDEDARSVIMGIVSAAEKSVKNSQAGQKLDPAEMLKQLKVGKVTIDTNGNVQTDIYLISGSGVTSSIYIEV